MTLLGLFVLLIAVVLLVSLVQQLGALPGLFATGTSVSQRMVGILVFAVILVLIVWLISHFLPVGPVRLT